MQNLKSKFDKYRYKENLLSDEDFKLLHKQKILRVYGFDLDDNLLKMPTKIYVLDKRINKLRTLTTEEYAKEKNNPNFEIFPDSFIEMTEKYDKQFLKDMLEAPVVKENWKYFVEAINNSCIFAIITARAHNPKTLALGIRKIIDEEKEGIKKKKIISSLKNFFNTYDIDFIGGDDESLIDYYIFHLCRFYTCSHPSFLKKYPNTSISILKTKAWDDFEDYVKTFAKKIGVKKITMGFSDDDIDNITYMMDFFNKKIKNNDYTDVDLNFLKRFIYKTTDSSVSKIFEKIKRK